MEEIWSFVTTCMKLENIISSEMKQSQKDKYSMCVPILNIWSSQVLRNKKYNGGCQQRWGGEMGSCCSGDKEFHLVFQDEKF